MFLDGCPQKRAKDASNGAWEQEARPLAGPGSDFPGLRIKSSFTATQFLGFHCPVVNLKRFIFFRICHALWVINPQYSGSVSKIQPRTSTEAK
jgi:hypothetical protein